MRKALHLLGILNDVDVEWIAGNGTRRYVPSGTTLIREKTPIDSMYILLEGQLSVYTEALRGLQLAVLLPGEIVGEISFVDSRLPTASVMAVADSELLALSRNVLLLKLEKDTAFAARFYRAIAAFLADRIRTTVGKFGYGPAQQDNAESLDEVEDVSMDEISMAAIRFDKMLKALRTDYRPKAIA
jgi:CRP/FNR family cyclic AMP-dependent transcriptional regulator